MIRMLRRKAVQKIFSVPEVIRTARIPIIFFVSFQAATEEGESQRELCSAFHDILLGGG